MKKILPVIILVVLTGYSVSLMAQAKRFILIEHFTQASCAPCAAQNPYLEAVLEQTRGTTHHIAYHTSWPGYDPMYLYNTAGSTARVNYYGVNAVPDVLMLGNYYHGGPTGVTKEVVDDAGTEPSPIRVKVSETSNGTARTVTVKVFTLGTLASANYKVRVAVVEKWIHYATPPGTNGEKDFPDVFRQMLPDNSGAVYTPAPVGDSVTFTYNYNLDTAVWDTTQIYTIAFIQNETTKEVINSGSSLASGWELYGIDPCFASGHVGDVRNFHYKLVNLKSTAETYRIKVTSNLPYGWSSDFEIGSNVYTDSVDINIPANTTLDMNLNVAIGSTGGISNSLVSMQAVGDTNYDPQTIYGMVMSGIYELIVNNDGSWGGNSNTTAADYQQNYINGLTYAGSTYFDVIRMGALKKAYKSDALGDIYNYYFNVSWTFPALTDSSVALFSSEMDKGKNMFISGQDIGWDTYGAAADGAHGTPATKAFYTNYMSSKWNADGGSADNKLIANTEDTIFGALPTSDVVNVYGGSYFYPDEINAVGSGINIFHYMTGATKMAGVRATNGTWKMVYLAPSLEMVKDTNVRKEIIKISHDWFGGPNLGIQPVTGAASNILGQCYPNPVTGKTTILLNNITGNMIIEVVDITGRIQVAVPVHEGMNSVTVDAGSLSNGLYLYRLVSGGKVLEVHKMQIIH